jgi:predicted GIY-YIG superfamily endonuclease
MQKARSENYFIYCLYCPIEKRIKYIGMTTTPDFRLKQHCSNTASNVGKEKCKWINKLKESGLVPQMRVLENVQGFSAAARKEREYIFKISFKRDLLNVEVRPNKSLKYYIDGINKYRQSLEEMLKEYPMCYENTNIVAGNIFKLDVASKLLKDLRPYKKLSTPKEKV